MAKYLFLEYQSNFVRFVTRIKVFQNIVQMRLGGKECISTNTRIKSWQPYLCFFFRCQFHIEPGEDGVQHVE